MSDEAERTVVQRVQKTISELRYSPTVQLTLKWSAILAGCIMIFVAGYFVSGIQQIFTPLPPPDVCPKVEGGLIITDCVAHRTLVATEAGATATRVYVWLTLAGVILSVVTVFGLFWTLWLNRRALDAAERANDNSSEIGRAQVRAYLTVTAVSVSLSEINTLLVEPEFYNSGQSPALEMWWSARAIVQWQEEDQVDGAAITPTHIEQVSPRRLDIPAQTSSQVQRALLFLSGAGGRVPCVGQLREVSVEIRFMYRDVFEEAHPSNTSFAGNPPIKPHGSIELTALHPVEMNYFQKKAEKLGLT